LPARSAKRVAYTADFGGKVPVDRRRGDLCRGARRFEELGASSRKPLPISATLQRPFLALRSQHFVVERELMLATHRDQIKPDIIWNTERGLRQSPSDLAAAERERAALFRRAAEFFATYDLLVSPGASTPAFDVESADARNDRRQEARELSRGLADHSGNHHDGLPSIAVPCGFDRYGRPVGLQMVGPHRGEAELLQAAVLFEQMMGFPPGADRSTPGAAPPIG
jgi:amidase